MERKSALQKYNQRDLGSKQRPIRSSEETGLNIGLEGKFDDGKKDSHFGLHF
jgi:hypothetical protein